jgi:hypothetical protein
MMRGVLIFLVLVTILALGLAGCPKDDSATTGAKPYKAVGSPDSGGESNTDAGSTDGGE